MATYNGTTGNDSAAGSNANDAMYGGAGNDTLSGEAGNDSLFGGTGNDSLNGGAGNDTIDGGDGNDSAQGGDGTDSLQGGAGGDSLFGGNSNDTIAGGNDNDSLDGGSGNDSLSGDAGNDTVFGGAGSDVMSGGDGADSLNDGDGSDLVYGGSGNDTVTASTGYDRVYGGDGNDQLSGGNDIYEDLYGGAGDDTIIAGSAEIDWVYGGSGNDSLDGGDGNFDLVRGGQGADTALGGKGADIVEGGTGNDEVFGGADADTLSGDDGADSVYGGTGSDQISGGAGADTIDGGDDADLIRGDIQVATIDTYASGGGDATTVAITNASSQPVEVYWINGSGTPVSSGTLGPGETFGAKTTTGQTWALRDPATGDWLSVYEGDSDAKHSFAGSGGDQITGGAGSDTIYGDGGNDTIDGGADNDQVFGGSGDDRVTGGAGDDRADLGTGNDSFGSWGGEGGNDTVFGGQGDDSIIGGAGNDVLAGGEGQDTAVFSGPVGDYSFDRGPNGELIVTDTVEGRDGTDTLDQVEYATFDGVTYRVMTGDGGDNQTLQGPDDGTPVLVVAYGGADWGGGHATDDVMFGGDGSDTLDGGEGSDTLDGGNDNDLLRGDGGDDAQFGGRGDDTLQGGAGSDALDGGAGADRLEGGGGDDALAGGDGADTLTGGAGSDTIATGAGADVVELTGGGGEDRVTDFDMTRVDGRTVDRLDVSGLVNENGDPVTWRDVTVSDTNGDGTGDAVLTFPGGERVVMQGVSPEEASGKGNMAAMGIPCFAAGTPILTPGGEVAVETLRAGDMVATTEGPRRVIWAGCRALTGADLDRRPDWRPVHVPPGALGNRVALRLSQQHAVLMRSGEGQPVLVRARHLAEAGVAGLRIARGLRRVAYHHVLLDRHAVLSAAGAPAESFFPGPTALAMLHLPDRLAVLAAVQAVAGSVAGYGPRAHPLAGRSALKGLTPVRAAFVGPGPRDGRAAGWQPATAA